MKIFGVTMPLGDSGAMDATLANVGSKATYAGSGGSFVGWLTSSEAGIVIGIVMAVGGFLTNWYFSRKRDKREQEAHVLRMRRLAHGLEELHD